jgi:Domain of unknown function (DUF1942)
VKFATTTVKTALGAAGIAAVSVFTAATASAAPANIQGFGASEQLVDGPMVTNYTVSNLRPSNATIPGFKPAGKLYQADIVARSDAGTVQPVVSDFNARAANGQTYRVVHNVPVPNGLNPAPIGQGGQASGSLFFDVTGQPPNGVVYNDGVQDVLIWTSNV